MDELRECPFCGTSVTRVSAVRDGYQAGCRQCGASGPPQYHGPAHMRSANERAIEAWNTRAGDTDE